MCETTCGYIAGYVHGLVNSTAKVLICKIWWLYINDELSLWEIFCFSFFVLSHSFEPVLFLIFFFFFECRPLLSLIWNRNIVCKFVINLWLHRAQGRYEANLLSCKWFLNSIKNSLLWFWSIEIKISNYMLCAYEFTMYFNNVSKIENTEKYKALINNKRTLLARYS